MISVRLPAPHRGGVRRLLRAIAMLIIVLPFLALLLLAGLDRGWFDRPLETLLSRKLGRTVKFGSFRTHLLTASPQIEIRDLTVANAHWDNRRPMVQIDHLSASLKLAPLLVGRIEAPILTVDGIALNLVRLRDGRNNWTFGSGHLSGAEFEPLRGTRALTIRRGTLDFVDAQRSVHFTGHFEQRPSGTMPFALVGTSMLAKVPLQLRARGGGLNGPGVSDAYPFVAELVDGAMRVRAQGTSGQPFDFKRFEVRIDAKGPNLADVGYLFNLGLPNSAPFKLQTQARGAGPHFAFDRLRVRFGQSDVDGWVRSDHSSQIPKVVAALSSRVWTRADVEAALSPIAPRASARSRSGATAVQPAGHWMLSDEPFPIQNLRALDLDAHIRVRELRGYPLALHDITTRLDLTKGKLTSYSLLAGLYGGRLIGKMRLDGQATRPVVTMQGGVRDVHLDQLAHGTRARMSGLLDVDIDMRGEGRSLHQAAATASGSASVRIIRGSLPPAAAYMLGGETLRAIGSLGDSRRQMTLDCASVHVSGSSGRLTARSIAMHTAAGDTGGSGWIDLAGEKLHFTLLGAPARRRLFHVTMPIVVQGSFRQPTVTVLPGQNARKIGLKGKLGVMLSPVAALIPMGREPALAIGTCR